jgi:hypothetical protein
MKIKDADNQSYYFVGSNGTSFLHHDNFKRLAIYQLERLEI